jgi:site-specific recombinase XerD
MANILFLSRNGISLPNSLPTMSAGKLNCRIRLRTDYAKANCKELPVYVQVTANRVVKRIPLGISIDPLFFDSVKQRVKSKCKFASDLNLIIEKKLADINTVEINFRLQDKELTLAMLLEELNNPTARMDFIKFWTDEMVRQKDLLGAGTYRQQRTVLNKVKEFQNPIYCYSINEDLVNDLKAYWKKKGNCGNTIASIIKSFKKYLHIANKQGIVTPITFDEIKNKSFKGNRTFLMPSELQKLNEFYNSKFINSTYKLILQRFLFSCFTGLRFSDNANLTTENIIEDYVAFTAEKTGKFQRIKLNESAKSFLDGKNVLNEKFTNEYTNRELKHIAKLVGITKKVTFHVSRHTFATNFLICGGRIEHLQKILGHSKIEETMIYVHIVEQITDVQINQMDDILKPKIDDKNE